MMMCLSLLLLAHVGSCVVAAVAAAGDTAVAGGRLHHDPIDHRPRRLEYSNGTLREPGSNHSLLLRGFSFSFSLKPDQANATDEDALVSSLLPGANFARLVMVHWHDAPTQSFGDCSSSDASLGFLTAVCLEQFDRIVAWATQHMWVVLTARASLAAGDGEDGATVWSNATLRKQMVDMWSFLAERYRGWDNIAGFEVMSEPRIDDAAAIHAFHLDACGAVWAVDEAAVCFVGPGKFYDRYHLDSRYVIPDRPVVYAANMFDYVEGTDATLVRAELLRKLGMVSNFSTAFGVPVWIDQFGVQDSDPGGDIAQSTYLAELLELFAETRFHWSYWIWRRPMAWACPGDYAVDCQLSNGTYELSDLKLEALRRWLGPTPDPLPPYAPITPHPPEPESLAECEAQANAMCAEAASSQDFDACHKCVWSHANDLKEEGCDFDEEHNAIVTFVCGSPPPTAVAAARGIPRLGIGNELVWQSTNDTVLSHLVATTGATIAGRYPGGTPSDYWDWSSGWATDVPDSPVRQARPREWREWARMVGGDTLLVVNQLTSSLNHSLAGLAAHASAGTTVSLVELGNEMYDSTRGDVTAAYPDGGAYAQKMSSWAESIKSEYPAASVALVAMTWRPGLDPNSREALWNAQVFRDAALLENIDAATLHPYFGISWPDGASADDASAVAAVLSAPFAFVDSNVQMLSALPSRLRLWVTEVAAYGAPSLDMTWLQTFANIIFETLLLVRLPRVDVLTPYCVACGDPIAPNFFSSAALASPPTHSVVPPALAGLVPWNATIRSAAHAAYFRLCRDAAGTAAQMEEIDFGEEGSAAATVPRFVGWRIQRAATEGTSALFVLHLGSDPAVLDVAAHVAGGMPAGLRYNASLLFPHAVADITEPLLPLSEFGQSAVVAPAAQPLDLPPYSVIALRMIAAAS